MKSSCVARTYCCRFAAGAIPFRAEHWGQHSESPREFQKGEHTGAPAGLAAGVGYAVR